MVPDSILSILENEPDTADVYRFKFHNNHAFIERLKLEFYHTARTEADNAHITTTSRFYWGGPESQIVNDIFRLYDAYDDDG